MLRTLEVENLKNLDGTYNLGSEVHLKGPSGAGKTTFGEAIWWLFSGRDRRGSQTTTHLFRDPEAPMRVRGVMSDGTEIERRQLPSGTKTIKVNRIVTKESDLEQMLPVSWQIFASIFLVGFFNTLSETDRRQIMMTITPNFDRDEVFAQLAPNAAAKGFKVDWAKPTKARFNEYNPLKISAKAAADEAKGVVKERLNRFNELRDGLPGSPPDFKDVSAILREHLAVELDKAKVWKAWLAEKQNHDRLEQQASQMREMKVARQQEIADLEGKLAIYSEPTEALDTLVRLRMERHTLEEGLGKAEETLSSWNMKRGLIVSPSPMGEENQCPTCGHKISDAKRKEVEAEINEARLKMKEATSKIDLAKTSVDLMRSELAKIRSEISSREARLASEKSAFIADQKRIATMLESLKNKSFTSTVVPDLSPEPRNPENDETIRQLQAKIVEAELENKRQWAEIEVWKTKRADVEKLGKSIKDVSEKSEKLNLQVEIYEEIAKALHPTRGVENIILMEKIKSVQANLPYINGAPIEFVFQEPMLNGELKEVFKVYWNSKPMELLSSGEQILVSAAIASMIDTLTDHVVGMHYIDDATLVSSAPPWPIQQNNSTQLIVAQTDRTLDRLVVETSIAEREEIGHE